MDNENKRDASAPHAAVDTERTTAHDYGADPELNAEANHITPEAKNRAKRLRENARLLQLVSEKTSIAMVYQHNVIVSLVEAVGLAKGLSIDDSLLVMREFGASLIEGTASLDRLKELAKLISTTIESHNAQANRAEGRDGVEYKYAKAKGDES